MMRIIEIEALENGAHRSQTCKVCPEGYAILPEEVEIPESFPFVKVTTTEKDGKIYVKKLTAQPVPEPTPTPHEITEEERLDALEAAVLALMMEG